MGNKPNKNMKIQSGQTIDPPHPMMNNTTIVIKDDKYFVRSEWPYFSHEKYQKWKITYFLFLKNAFKTDKINEISHPIAKNILLPLNYHYQKINVCSPTGIAIMEYQIVDKTLAQDIQERSHQNLPYLQQQLWNLLNVLSQTVTYLHSKNISLGDLRSQNVVIDQQQMQIKVSTEVSWMGQPDLFSKLLNNWQVFVTPQILQSMKDNKFINPSLMMSNNDFQVGMVLAESILLQDLSKIYETTNKTQKILNKQKHKKLVEKLLGVKYYSKQLLLFVVGMIQLQSLKRIKSQQICQLLQDQQNDLKEMRKINISKQKMSSIFSEKYQTLEQTLAFVNQKLSSNSYGRKFYSTKTRKSTQQSYYLQDKIQPPVSSYQSYIPSNDVDQSKNMKLQDFIAVSQNKQVYGSSVLPFTPTDPTISKYLYKPDNSFQVSEENKDISKNFSFNSLQSAQPPQVVEQTITKPIQSNSFGKSTETLLIAPSVYSVSNPPESYISYHYTQSLQKNQLKKQKDNSKSNENSFQFEPELPLQNRKQSQSKKAHILIEDLKRRTISASISSWEKKGERESL